jgi:hypothetical protein
MKKLFALVLALCLLCGCTALADNEISWEQVEPLLEQSGVNGNLYTFDQIAVAIFIPEGLESVELPNDSYIGYFAAEDGSAVAVQYVNVEGMDLETYTAALPGVGATEIETGTVNGMPCVTYEVPANKTMNIAFTTEAGYILEVVVGPVEDDNAKTAAGFIMASVMAVPQ